MLVKFYKNVVKFYRHRQNVEKS